MIASQSWGELEIESKLLNHIFGSNRIIDVYSIVCCEKSSLFMKECIDIDRVFELIPYV